MKYVHMLLVSFIPETVQWLTDKNGLPHLPLYYMSTKFYCKNRIFTHRLTKDSETTTLRPGSVSTSDLFNCTVYFKGDASLCATIDYNLNLNEECPYQLRFECETTDGMNRHPEVKTFDCQDAFNFSHGERWQYCSCGLDLSITLIRKQATYGMPWKYYSFDLKITQMTNPSLTLYGDNRNITPKTRRTTQATWTVRPTQVTWTVRPNTDDNDYNKESDSPNVVTIFGVGAVVTFFLMILTASCCRSLNRGTSSSYQSRVGRPVAHQGTIVHPVTTVGNFEHVSVDPPPYASVCQQNNIYNISPAAENMHQPYSTATLANYGIEPSAPPPYIEDKMSDPPPPPYPDTDRY